MWLRKQHSSSSVKHLCWGECEDRWGPDQTFRKFPVRLVGVCEPTRAKQIGAESWYLGNWHVTYGGYLSFRLQRHLAMRLSEAVWGRLRPICDKAEGSKSQERLSKWRQGESSQSAVNRVGGWTTYKRS